MKPTFTSHWISRLLHVPVRGTEMAQQKPAGAGPGLQFTSFSTFLPL